MILAHDPHDAVPPSELWGSWHPQPGIVAALVVAGVLYGRGLARSWARPVPLVSRAEAAAFRLGLLTLAAALLSPLEAAASTLFAAHMIQHLALIVIAAPLLVCGRPLLVTTMALPARIRRPLRRVERRPAVRRTAALAARTPVVWAVGAIALWAWHLPTLYDAAVLGDAVHAVEHTSLFGTAVLLWAAVLGRQRRQLAAPVAVALLFATGLQGAALGAVLTFAQSPLYEVHRPGAPLWGMTALEDQQLAGVLMWVPPGFVYLAVMAVLLVRWFATLEPPDSDLAVGTVVREHA